MLFSTLPVALSSLILASRALASPMARDASAAPPKVSTDPSCQKMFESCITEVNPAVDDIFNTKSCMLGAAW